MTWVATAVIGSAVVGAYSANQASKAQSKAAKDAAWMSSQSANASNALQKEMYDQTREDQTPWRDTGAAALNQLAIRMGIDPRQAHAAGGGQKRYTYDDLLESNFAPNSELYAKDEGYRKAYDALKGQLPYMLAKGERINKYGAGWVNALNNSVDLNALNERMAALAAQEAQTQPDPTDDPNFGSLTKRFSMADFEADPGYAFRQSGGQKAIERSAAARGGLLSGAALKGIERFGQGLASDEYLNAYNRFNNDQNNEFSRFSTLAGVGQTANNALQQAGNSYANAVTGINSNNAMNQGNALLAQGNARASGYLGVGNALSGALGAYGMMKGGGGGYQMGTGTLGNNYAMSQGYLPLNHSAANAGFYD